MAASCESALSTKKVRTEVSHTDPSTFIGVSILFWAATSRLRKKSVAPKTSLSSATSFGPNG